jgi:hypothetical protein
VNAASTTHSLALVTGVVVVLVVLWDAFETMVQPRRVSRRLRLTRALYRSTWIPWRAVAKLVPAGRNRESFLSVFGPISLLILLALWAVLLVLGFTLLQWGAGSGVQSTTGERGFWIDLYMSGATLFTMMPSDLAPASAAARALTAVEAGTGFALLAIVIGYLPTLSQAFSRREMNVSLLDPRGGSPPSAGEILRRHAGDAKRESLLRLLEQWEGWCADLLETQVSSPVLAYYRSQHVNQSWVAALTAVLDVCALVVVGVEQESQQHAARMTLAMGRHAAVDLTLVFRLKPRAVQSDRLPAPALRELRQTLREAGLTLREEPDMDAKLERLRALYEPYMNALGSFLMMPLPQWLASEGVRDNWKSVE